MAGIKVLDFGLAKAMAPDPASGPAAGVSQMPTITTPAMTQAGIILGTAAYMSPEQAKGQPVDKRADVWAFGCVLYEMLTGRRAFDGDSMIDVLGAVARLEPDWTALPRDVPAELRTLLQRCLVKDPRARVGDVAVARYVLAQPAPSRPSSGQNQGSSRRTVELALAGLLAAAVGAGGVWLSRSPTSAGAQSPTLVYRTSILPPDGVRITDTSGNVPSRRLALSPDGQRLAFTGTDASGVIRLWVRELNGATARVVEGTDGAAYPFWAPDSRRLGFFSEGQGNALLKVTDLSGGSPLTLCQLPGVNGSGGSWNERDEIVFGTVFAGPLRRVVAAGGPCTDATTLDARSGETSHINPQFLPGGRRVVFTATAAPVVGGIGIHVMDLDSKARRPLVPDGGNAVFAGGHLVYLRGPALLARPFDVDRMNLVGEPVVLSDDILVGGQAGFPAGALSVSQNGVLAYQAGGQHAPARLVWVDRLGQTQGMLVEGDLDNVELSPDGQRVAVAVLDTERRTRDLFVYDAARGVRRRLTFDAASDVDPTWSPDGARIAFGSRRHGPFDFFIRQSTPGGAEDPLFATGQDKTLLDWSPDSRSLLYSSPGADGVGRDIWALSLADLKATPFARTLASESSGQFSPNGRWVAYVSDESGRREVLVAPFPGPGEAVQVSTAGGIDPRWAASGSELFYWAGDRLTSVAVRERDRKPELGVSTPLFERRRRSQSRSYDVSPDGKRFLINEAVDDSLPVTLVVNWPALLKK